MDKRSNILVIVLFLLIVIGMFVFAYLKSNELQAPSVTEPLPSDSTSRDSILLEDRITAKHFNIDGQHVFAGEVSLPTPCDLLTVETRVLESYPEQIILDFKVINNAETCAEVISVQRFLTLPVSASTEAKISATFNGKPIELNLIPAAPGEKPEEFEVYQKG